MYVPWYNTLCLLRTSPIDAPFPILGLAFTVTSLKIPKM
jgi:hypothetical protein